MIAIFAALAMVFTPPATTLSSGVLTSDSIAAVRTAERFHAALVSGDSATALELLAPSAVIMESGSIETRQQYRFSPSAWRHCIFGRGHEHARHAQRSSARPGGMAEQHDNDARQVSRQGHQQRKR